MTHAPPPRPSVRTTLLRRSRLLQLVVLATVGGLGLALARPATTPAPATPDSARYAWTDSDAGRFVFFAVLEGLFLDGVQDAVVQAVLDGPGTVAPQAPGASDAPGVPEPYGEQWWAQAVFVPGCPLCTPARAAFGTYRTRASFQLKPPSGPGRTRDAFGGGLPDTVAARLVHPDREERLAALRTLVATWIDARLERQRATPAERAGLLIWMEDAAKQGMAQLREATRERPELRESWASCAFCDGAVEGVRLETPAGER
ncbi:MAG: hypothetical protein ACYTG2_14140 [Planctomycetota bacterium]